MKTIDTRFLNVAAIFNFVQSQTEHRTQCYNVLMRTAEQHEKADRIHMMRVSIEFSSKSLSTSVSLKNVASMLEKGAVSNIREYLNES